MQNKKTRYILAFLLFLFGLGFLAYPFLSNSYYRSESGEKIADFTMQAEALSPEERAERLRLARAYNRTLDPSRMADPFSSEEKEGVAAYAQMLAVQEMIGHIVIPSIDVDLPVYAGTGDAVLQKGAGHLEGTSLPIGGKNTHAVITAHRGLPTALMFRNLDQLKIDQVFYYVNLGETLAYEVDQILTVEPSDFDPVLVAKGKDEMTLLTCTPYMINSHRLLVRGHRIPYTNPIPEQNRPTFFSPFYYQYLFFVSLVVILVQLVVVWRTRKRS